MNSSIALALIKEKDIHLEACPSSSVGTGSVTVGWEDHPIRKFKEYGLNFGINTDDQGVLLTSLND